MKVTVYETVRTSIAKFADEHRLHMEVRRYGDSYCASFERGEIKNGAILSSLSGRGPTPAQAINDYARQISGKLLVIDAYGGKDRRVMAVPELRFRLGAK